MTTRIPNVDTFSCLIDRLIIENHKIAYLENTKWAEQHTEKPDKEKITNWDKAMRTASETRSALKNRLDSLLKECVESGRYDFLAESRTF
jgi:transcriptional regulatory protein LevR